MRTILALVYCAAFAAICSAAQPDSGKVIRVAFSTAETGFDPQATGDAYSGYVTRAIFDSLYRCDYLARPYKVVPNTAAALPEISPDGKTWTMRVRSGIYFADDPAFKGKRRELTAQDYVYSFKRILDPKVRSPGSTLLEGRFIGADAVVAKAKETGKFDYDALIEGLQAIDRYTLRFKLNFPDYELLSNLTESWVSAVAREVIEAYGDSSSWVMANPVGTGPYRLKEWRRGQRIVLEANADFRDDRYPEPSSDADRALTKTLAGRKLPLVRRIEINIIEEANPQLLAFAQKQLDFLAVPNQLIANVVTRDGKLKAELAKQGVTLQRDVLPAIGYAYFNMEDPIVGGYTAEKIALRRAIAMGYNADEEIRVIRQGQAIPMTQITPPGVSGHDPTLKLHIAHDVTAARALLDKFGYKDRDGDGFREMPDGRPLTIRMGSATGEVDRQYDELWQRSMKAIGIRIEFIKQKWPDLAKMAQLGQLQMWRVGLISFTPETFSFHARLYSKNIPSANASRFNLAEYDRLYEQGRALPDSPERTKILRRMSEIVNAYAPWVFLAYRIENVIVQPWVVGYKYNPTYQFPFPYLDVVGQSQAFATK